MTPTDPNPTAPPTVAPASEPKGRYATVCSGIEAPSMAFKPLGWRPIFFSEIEPFACAVLAQHYPHIPNYGNMLDYKEWPDATLDVLVAGTPCQDFSVAGLRAGIAAPRGNLTLAFLGVIERYRPSIVLWENVPGVLSSDKGRALGAFLGGLAQLGYGFAYRVLDAQFFGVPQRRERVFVVGCSGGRWQRAAAVLFERESLSWDPPPRREAWEDATGTITAGFGRRRGVGLEPAQLAVAGTLQASGKAAGSATQQDAESGLPVPTNAAFGGNNQSSAITAKTHGSSTDRGTRIVSSMRVRRIMPIEAERLQGFPDNYTRVHYRGGAAKDGPRYRALGNSMAVPVIAWIGRRIELMEAME